VGMAEQTRGQDGPSGQLGPAEAGRQVPDLLLRIPADGRLEDVAVAIREVRVAAAAGADHVIDLPGLFREGAAGGVEPELAVPDPVAVALDAELQAEGLESPGLPRAFRPALGPGDRHERAAHGVMRVRAGLLLVAPGTALLLDIADGRVHVPKRTGVREPRV